MSIETFMELESMSGVPVIVRERLLEQHPDRFSDGAIDGTWLASILPDRHIYVDISRNTVLLNNCADLVCDCCNDFFQ